VANGLVDPGFGRFLLRYFSHSQPWPAGAFDGWEHGFTWNHLWYLVYLWTYTIVLALLLPLLRSRAGQRLLEGSLALTVCSAEARLTPCAPRAARVDSGRRADQA
jgi:hypothetical protein